MTHGHRIAVLCLAIAALFLCGTRCLVLECAPVEQEMPCHGDGNDNGGGNSCGTSWQADLPSLDSVILYAEAPPVAAPIAPPPASPLLEVTTSKPLPVHPPPLSVLRV